MIPVCIIDDEPLARGIIAEYLQAFPQCTIVAQCGDGFEGARAIQQHKPALIFLDVQMPKINGFEMLELLENKPDVIFTTAFDEFALKAFEAHAVDYLLKPISEARFGQAMQRWMQAHKEQQAAPARPEPVWEAMEQPAQRERVVVKQGSIIKIIPVHDILYLEAADDFVKIHTEGGSFLKNKTMGYFEKTLDPAHFVRTHRSYIVAIEQITRIDPYEKDSFVAILRRGQKIPVSRSGYPRLKAALGL